VFSNSQDPKPTTPGCARLGVELAFPQRSLTRLSPAPRVKAVLLNRRSKPIVDLHRGVQSTARVSYGPLPEVTTLIRSSRRRVTAMSAGARDREILPAIQRRRFKQTQSLEERLSEEAKRLRDEAALLPSGADREERLRKARQADTGSYMSDWLRAPGLQPPK
jgi:hypothetical protein